MARPQQRTAAKDYPQHGIKKGDRYWYVKIKTGPYSSREMRQKEPFKPNQLTSSAWQQSLNDIEEMIAAAETADDAQAIADRFQELADEQQEKIDNMEAANLTGGSTYDLITERKDAAETAQSEAEDIASDWESAFSDWESEIETYKDELEEFKSYTARHAEWENSEPDDEMDPAIHKDWEESEPAEVVEPTLPDNTNEDGDDFTFDATDFQSRLGDISVG